MSTGHVDRDAQSAKFRLNPVLPARNLGFAPAELRHVQRLSVNNNAFLLKKWHEWKNGMNGEMA